MPLKMSTNKITQNFVINNLKLLIDATKLNISMTTHNVSGDCDLFFEDSAGTYRKTIRHKNIYDATLLPGEALVNDFIEFLKMFMRIVDEIVKTDHIESTNLLDFKFYTFIDFNGIIKCIEIIDCKGKITILTPFNF